MSFYPIKTLKQTYTSNGTIVIPAGYQIVGVTIVNTTANAVTGGIKIGTTNGGTEVAVAIATGANAILGIPDATMLLKTFSTSSDTTLYIQAVVAWNSASVDLSIIICKI